MTLELSAAECGMNEMRVSTSKLEVIVPCPKWMDCQLWVGRKVAAPNTGLKVQHLTRLVQMSQGHVYKMDSEKRDCGYKLLKKEFPSHSILGM